MASAAPLIPAREGLIDAVKAALGPVFLSAKDEVGEVSIDVARESAADALTILRDRFEYQQLMEIAGVDYPERAERFDVVYHLLSVTKNHRLRVRVTTDEEKPVPTVTGVYPSAGWLEREVFDMYGVIFDGNTDLRRILTDYGFEGHPQRKDFPLTGYHELRYSEEEKRVVYEPVELAQDFRSFDYMSPWEGADYVLPGDEKAAVAPPPPPVAQPKTTDKPADTGAGAKADAKAAEKVAPASSTGTAGPGQGQPAPKELPKAEPGAPEPTEARPARKPRKGRSPDTAEATEPKPRAPRKPRARKTDGDGA